LSILEDSLPNSVIIFSIRPNLKGKKLELKLEIGAKSAEAFLSFIDSLRKNGFQSIEVNKERQNEKGLILASITLSFPLKEV
jgi:hypothetical protein